jgi:hypothetical protein
MLLLVLVRDRNTWTLLDRKRQIYSKSKCLFLYVLPIIKLREKTCIEMSMLGFSNKADCFDLKAKTVYSNVNVLFYHLQVSS